MSSKHYLALQLNVTMLKDQKQDSEVHTHLILEKKIFTFGGLSNIFYFHAKQNCAFLDLSNNDYHNLMKPIILSYQYTSRGLPITHQTRKSSNKILVIIPEHPIKNSAS